MSSLPSSGQTLSSHPFSTGQLVHSSPQWWSLLTPFLRSSEALRKCHWVWRSGWIFPETYQCGWSHRFCIEAIEPEWWAEPPVNAWQTSPSALQSSSRTVDSNGQMLGLRGTAVSWAICMCTEVGYKSFVLHKILAQQSRVVNCVFADGLSTKLLRCSSSFSSWLIEWKLSWKCMMKTSFWSSIVSRACHSSGCLTP